MGEGTSETSWERELLRRLGRGNFRDGGQIIMKTYIRQIGCEFRRSVKLAEDLHWRYLAETMLNLLILPSGLRLYTGPYLILCRAGLVSAS